MLMRHIVICGLSPAVLYSSTLSQTRHDFGQKVIEYNMFFLQRLSETFLILGRNEQEIIKNVYSSLREVPVILARC